MRQSNCAILNKTSQSLGNVCYENGILRGADINIRIYNMVEYFPYCNAREIQALMKSLILLRRQYLRNSSS
jgi:hypothetical protein